MVVFKSLETEDELDGKAFVHDRAWKEAYVGLIDQAFLDARSVEKSRQYAAQAFADGKATLLAKDGERVVGFADYGAYRGDDLPDAGEVYAIYILKDYYGKGVGYGLMSRALAALKEYRRFAVWVLEGNERAIRFYQRFGFRFDGQKQTLILGAPVTDARMILER